MRYRTLVAFCILWVGTLLAVTWFAQTYTQKHDNATRCSIVALALKLTENTTRSYRATLASPTTTEAQKHAAQVNLNGIIDTLHTTEAVLHFPHGKACTIPEK